MRSYRVFPPSVEESTKGVPPRVPQAPRGAPEGKRSVDPISTSTDKSIGITFCIWTITPWFHLDDTPLGLICLYVKVMLNMIVLEVMMVD